MIPQGLKFTRTHEWILRDGEVMTIGISEYAVKQLGDIVHIELPSAGMAVKREGPFGVIESVKAAVEVYSPVDGEVVQANDEITSNLELLSQDPFGQGWMVKVKASDPQQLNNLMTASDYEGFIDNPESVGKFNTGG